MFDDFCGPVSLSLCQYRVFVIQLGVLQTLIESVSLDIEAVEHFKVWQKAHDQVDLILSFEVDVETDESGHGREGLHTLLEVFQDNVIQS